MNSESCHSMTTFFSTYFSYVNYAKKNCRREDKNICTPGNRRKDNCRVVSPSFRDYRRMNYLNFSATIKWPICDHLVYGRRQIDKNHRRYMLLWCTTMLIAFVLLTFSWAIAWMAMSTHHVRKRERFFEILYPCVGRQNMLQTVWRGWK